MNDAYAMKPFAFALRPGVACAKAASADRAAFVQVVDTTSSQRAEGGAAGGSASRTGGRVRGGDRVPAGCGTERPSRGGERPNNGGNHPTGIAARPGPPPFGARSVARGRMGRVDGPDIHPCRAGSGCEPGPR